MTGSKIIIFATLMALTAFVFTTIPFLAFVIKGILKEDSKNNEKNMFRIFLNALIFHIFAVLAVIFIFSMLDILLTNTGESDHYVKDVAMKEIFWNAHDKTSIINYAQVGESYQIQGAYSLINAVYTVLHFFYGLTPIFVVFLSTYVGYEINKNRQDISTFRLFVNVTIYVIAGYLIYIFWLNSSNIAMYLPDGDSLTTLTNKFWIDTFTKE